MDIASKKQATRLAIKELLKKLDHQYKKQCGQKIAKHFAAFVQTNQFRLTRAALFYSLGDELDTKTLDQWLASQDIERFYPHKDAAGSPIFCSSKHEKPVSAQELDVIFVPGLAFDRSGNRLGRGQAFYDRALSKVSKPPGPLLIGLAMDEQIVSEVACEPHDVVMDYLCTPKIGMYNCENE